MSKNNYTYPVVLAIAGSDSGGGAGIQADIKSLSAQGVYAATAITAITAQNTLGVKGILTIPADMLALQAETVLDDIQVHAVKIGMLPSVEIVNAVVKILQKYQPPHVVVDPVMIATSGDKLITDETVDYLKNELFPLATLITPNIDEAEVLSGQTVHTVDDMKAAAATLLGLGCQAVLVKGGHLKGPIMYDVLLTQSMSVPLVLESPYIDSENVHGTGCSLASAIAAQLALGLDMEAAVKVAKIYINQAIASGKDIKIGHGHGPINHFFNPQPLGFFKQTMKVFLNKQSKITEAGSTLLDFLTQSNIPSPETTAATVNGQVVPKTEWEKHILQENDQVSLFRAACGG